MNEIKIDVQYPKLDHVKHEANIGIKTTDIKGETKVIIENIFWNKKEVFLNISNQGDTSFLNMKAGDAYPNSMLGDIIVEIPQNISIVCLNDIRRIVRTDKSAHLIFDKNFNGTIYAFGTLEVSE